MDGIEQDETQARRANELYWESDTSVNRIADQLGLSKGSLYAAIEPLESESMCPLCQEPLVYLNRTALEKGHLQCSGCGTEFEEKGSGIASRTPVGDETREQARPRRRPPTSEEDADSDIIGDVARAPVDYRESSNGEAEADRPSGQLVLSTTLLALGVGLLLARVFRR